ncbi:nicotinate (nicotinamide) nucleotide adenylyltransferase [Cytobacillus sp. IB215665]|uniref:nicotinate (nicotinamide) nucleotide adenylyltransferase n=1 Tax=Cytobacillus sp. IB215665 TaxID=3097357 RepID=UPI002A17ADA0|nr:nicotinate (nicotinamide) nucleotide adenylyltransferase [Cytobacillus sp. IB215665]MDX8366807.1 nicotinate (nicotinamide) nucleotide adenylyltransferase [Cytobacillus sp. IB215665]
MARIGIYGSSYDPVTNVHLWTASTVAHRCKLDYVVFLPCSNKRKDKRMNISDEHRKEMVKMAIESNPIFIFDDYEMNQDAWKIDTYTTMKHFENKYPGDELFFIMGADLLVDIGEGKWSNGDKLVSEFNFIIMARDGIDMLATIGKSGILRNNDDGNTFHLIDKGLAMEISSTYIRDELSMGGEPRYLMPENCYQYIKKHKLYMKRIG